MICCLFWLGFAAMILDRKVWRDYWCFKIVYMYFLCESSLTFLLIFAGFLLRIFYAQLSLAAEEYRSKCVSRPAIWNFGKAGHRHSGFSLVSENSVPDRVPLIPVPYWFNSDICLYSFRYWTASWTNGRLAFKKIVWRYNLVISNGFKNYEVISKTIKKIILLFEIYKATEESSRDSKPAGNSVARNRTVPKLRIRNSGFQ